MAEQLIYQRLHQCNNALPKNRDDLEIKNVKGKGKGLFTTKPIKKGSLITLYPVHIIIKYNMFKIIWTRTNPFLMNSSEFTMNYS